MPAKLKAKTAESKKADAALLPEVNIGMVGHVDHGKTTLTQALTGVWTDTHSEEIKRGITIRIGYADTTFYRCEKCKGPDAYSTSPKCIKCFSQAKPLRAVSFVDAPGHETLMTTVLSGASLMDGAILVISATEDCPQPQTREHLTALEIVGIKNIVVVQSKIDVVSEERALKHYEQIKRFLKGSIAENAQIIPLSAQRGVNIDALIEAIEERIPTPKRDSSKPPKLLVARSFDANRPGTQIEKLIGGIVGGSLAQGRLKVGDEVEIRPGIKLKERYQPIKTRIYGLQKSGRGVSELEPGGLAGVSTGLDPALTRNDVMGGNILGFSDSLPPVHISFEMKANIIERVVGTKEELKVEPIKEGESLLLTVGVARTVGAVTKSKAGKVNVDLKIPVCAEKGDRIVISRQILGRWRLIGWGEFL